MKLFVHVIEARGLLAMDSNGLSDPYVRLQLGKQRVRTKVVKESLNPWWDEEFNFRIGDFREELNVSVLDEDKYSDDFLGQVNLPLSKLLDAENLSLGTAWYQLEPKTKKTKNSYCGEIHLSISLYQNNTSGYGTPPQLSEDLMLNSDKSSELKGEPLAVYSNGTVDSYGVSEIEEAESVREAKPKAQLFFERMFQIFAWKNADNVRSSTRELDTTEIVHVKPLNSEANETLTDDHTISNSTFDELLEILGSKDHGGELPEYLPGGVILDRSFSVSPADLNSITFSPNSNFLHLLADVQGTTELHIEPWRFDNGRESLKRVVTYIKAATKLVKAVKATEDQTYLKADGIKYAVLASVSTPDVPFGNSFRCEVLYCIMPGPQLPSEGQSSRLVISWRINFLRSTMMKGMIENGAMQGLKDSYVQYAQVLSENVKPLDLTDVGSSKEQILASFHAEQESDWKLARRIFLNFTFVSFLFVGLYVTVHILLANHSTFQGLEFVGLDMPDSVGELVDCGVLILLGKCVLKMISHFLRARKQREGHHGTEAEGDGWLLTVALIEGTNLVAVDSSGYSDPYVVFTCNGKMKTSSIKFQILDPKWNEIFQFDALSGPPSTMDINVYDFDGPFDEAVSLGHSEINFVKSNLSELADVWISLEGKLAQVYQSRLHLRIFLNSTRGDRVVSDYLTKMEKEVGKKINLRSPQTNSTFQKLFGLAPDEFLINDFTCHLKLKLPIQGRLFLAPRIIGFYSNLFGYKTNFFFLWEDIEDIQVVTPSLTSMGTPSVLIILHRGRGLDARHGAKSLDPDGRLKFQFHSFVSFNVANRTIMALWKSRSLSPEQKLQIDEEESEEKNLQSEESGSFLGIEDANMSKVFSSIIPVPMNSLMEMFEGDSFEKKVMVKLGCVDYSTTPWESVQSDVQQRRIHYKFDRNISHNGREVTCMQTRSLHDKNGWLIEEAMTLQGAPFSDYFTLHLRYQIDDLPSKSKACLMQVSLRIVWLKSTKHQKRITKNVIANSSDRLKEMFSLVEKELAMESRRFVHHN